MQGVGNRSKRRNKLLKMKKLAIILIFYIFLTINIATATEYPRVTNGIGIQQIGERWVQTKAEGTEKDFVLWTRNASDKKTEIGFIVKEGINPNTLDLTDKTLTDETGTTILNDKNKEITLKYETAKCDGKDCYHISLTEAQAININNYIKIGLNSATAEYIPIEIISRVTPEYSYNATLECLIAGQWNNIPKIYLTRNKFGANITSLQEDTQCKYTIESNKAIEQYNNYTFGFTTKEDRFKKQIHTIDFYNTIYKSEIGETNYQYSLNNNILTIQFKGLYDASQGTVYIDPEYRDQNITAVDETGAIALSNGKYAAVPDIPYKIWSTKLIRWNTWEECSGNETRDASSINKQSGWVDNFTQSIEMGNCANGGNSRVDSLTNQWGEINTFDSQGFEMCFYIQPTNQYPGGNGMVVSARILSLQFGNNIDWLLTLQNITGDDILVQTADTANMNKQFICAGHNTTHAYMYQDNNLLLNVSDTTWTKPQNNDYLYIGGTSAAYNLDDIFFFRAPLTDGERDYFYNNYKLTNSTLTTSYNETPYRNYTITINHSKSYTNNANLSTTIKYLNNSLIEQAKVGVVFTGKQTVLKGDVSFLEKGYYGTNQNDTLRYHGEGAEVINYKQSVGIYSGNNRGYTIYNSSIQNNAGFEEYLHSGYTVVMKFTNYYNTTNYAPFLLQLTDKNLLDVYSKGGTIETCTINGCYGQGLLTTGKIIEINKTYTIAISYGGYEGYGDNTNMSIWVDGVLAATEERGNLSTPRNITTIGIFGLANEAGSGIINYLYMFEGTFPYEEMIQISNGSLDYKETTPCYDESCSWELYNSYADAIAFNFENYQNNKSVLINNFTATYEELTEEPPAATTPSQVIDVMIYNITSTTFWTNWTYTDAATDLAIIYLNGTYAGNISYPTNYADFAGGTPGSTYNVTIRAYDNTAGENSTDSDENQDLITLPTSTCTCPGPGNNWEIDMTDNCNITTPCNLVPGNLTFINTGTVMCNTSINLTTRGPPSGGWFKLETNCLILKQ